jgi:hypothetical protein
MSFHMAHYIEVDRPEEADEFFYDHIEEVLTFGVGPWGGYCKFFEGEEVEIFDEGVAVGGGVIFRDLEEGGDGFDCEGQWEGCNFEDFDEFGLCFLWEVLFGGRKVVMGNFELFGGL